MNKYCKYLGWATFSMIDRKTQDDHRSKVSVFAVFKYPINAKEYIVQCPNPENKKYYLPLEDLERFEQFYNFFQDLEEYYGEYAKEHINEGDFSDKEIERFRYVLNI